jgi:hypothetical protein
MKEQVQSGVCQDITSAIAGEFRDFFYPAGIQNFIAGGADKWPLHFYPAMLMMRVLGKSGLESVVSKDSKAGLADPGVLKAWKMYKDLCDLQRQKRRWIS